MDRLSIKEYRTLIRAKNLQMVDDDLRLHKQAWLNVQAGAQKEKGSGKTKKYVPVYKRFRDFYDYDEALMEAGQVTIKESKFTALANHIREKQNGNQ